MRTEIPAIGQSVKSARRWSPLAASVLIHMAGGIALLSIPATMDRPGTVSGSAALVTPLFYRPVILTQPVRRQVKITRAQMVAPMPKTPEPKVYAKQFPFPVPEPPRTVTVQMPEAVPQPPVPVAPVRLEASPLPTRAAATAAVKTGVFGSPGDAVNGRIPAPRFDVRTGGFDGNSGMPGGSSGTASGTAAHTLVQTGGFGDSTGSGTTGSAGKGRLAVVADAGFGNVRKDTPAPRRIEAAPAETPVEVLWKPKPQYTEEARARKLEGDVVLQVVFRAAGDVHVVRVVRGLGSGLDESARTAAEQIRFRPGRRDGVPVDRTGLVQITFELS